MPAWETARETNHVAAPPSDVTTYNPPFRAVFVGTAGDVVVRSAAGVDATYKCLAGSKLEVSGVQIRAASTATNLVAMW